MQSIKDAVYRASRRYSTAAGIDLPYFVKNTFWMAVRQVLLTASGLAVVMSFTWFATQELYGQYQLVLSILGIAYIATLPGMNTGILQAISRGHDGSYLPAVKRAFLFSFLGVLGMALWGGYLWLTGSPGLGMAVIVAGVFLPFTMGLDQWDSFLQGRELFEKSALWSIAQSMVFAAAMISVIVFGGNSILTVVLAHSIIYGGANVLFFFRTLRLRRSRKQDPAVIGYGWFLTKIGGLRIVATHLDKIVVGFFLGPVALATYGLGTYIAKRVQDFTKSILSVTTPKISRMNTVSKKRYLAIFFVSVICSVVLVAIIPYIVPILFTQSYSSASRIAQIILLFFPFFVLEVFYRNHVTLYLKDKRTQFIEAIFSPALKIALMIPLIIGFGVFGLAFAVGAEHLIALGALFWLARRERISQPEQ